MEDVRAGYGEVEVLKGINLEVDNGRFVAIIGPNGHGKTTILRTATGLLRASSGKILFDGEEITNLPAYKISERGLIHVQEGSRLFPRMTIEENLQAGAFSTSSWRKRSASLEQVYQIFPELAEKKKRLASSLNGSERQIVAIARGLMAAKAKVLLIDEPSAGIAGAIMKDLYRKIVELRESDIALVAVEPSMKRVADYDEVYLVVNGAVRIHGTPKEVLENYAAGETYLGENE